MAFYGVNKGTEVHNHIIDNVDKKLIRELQINSREKYVDIAKKLGMSEAGVRKRVGRLVEQEIVQLTAITAPGKVGYHSAAMIGLQVQMGKIDAVTKQLVRKSGSIV